MIATSAISQNWPKQTHWLWRTISSWNNGRKKFSLTFVDEKLQLRTTVDEGRWFWRPNYGPSFFYVQLYRHWRPPFFSVSFVVDPCVKNPHTLQASEHTARERERELPQANPRQICEQLSALWRDLETVLHGAFFLWFIFPDFSTRRFYFYSHFGVLFHRLFFSPKFSEEVCGFVRGWILWYFSATVMDLRAFWHFFSLVRLLLCFSFSMWTRLSHKRVVAEMHLSRLRGYQIWWLIPVLKWLRKSLSFFLVVERNS
jgi:hypothetical protein